MSLCVSVWGSESKSLNRLLIQFLSSTGNLFEGTLADVVVIRIHLLFLQGMAHLQSVH